MSGSLTPAQKQFYEENGYMFPIPILDQAEVRTMRGRFEELCAEIERRLSPRVV